MALPNITGHVIASGYNCQVRVGTNAGDAKVVGFVTSFQASEDFQTQEAVVLGVLGPISIDAQGYGCTITIDTLIPAKGNIGKGTNNPAPGAQQYDGDEGKISLQSLFASREKYMEAGAFQKIEYLDFYNKREGGDPIVAFSGVIITNQGVQIEGNSCGRSNVQMRALTRI